MKLFPRIPVTETKIQATMLKMENFYAAQIPATGHLQINDCTNFTYKLANDTKAAVHVGWTLGLAHIAPDITNII